MESTGRRIFWISISVAVVFWLADTLIDYVFYYEGESLVDVFLLDHRELSFRVLTSVFIIGLGGFLARAFIRQKKVEDALREKEEVLTHSLAEKELLLREIHHRVKNNMQIISSLLSLQSRFVGETEASFVLKECQNRIRAMALVHEKLYSTDSFIFVDVAGYIEALAMHLIYSSSIKKSSVRFVNDVDDVHMNMDTMILCGLIVNELVSNALKHAFPDPGKDVIRVSVMQNGNNAYKLEVSDNGRGVHDEFDLFSTNTLGLGLVQSLVEQLQGTMEVEKGDGLTFSISFPGL